MRSNNGDAYVAPPKPVSKVARLEQTVAELQTQIIQLQWCLAEVTDKHNALEHAIKVKAAQQIMQMITNPEMRPQVEQLLASKMNL